MKRMRHKGGVSLERRIFPYVMIAPNLLIFMIFIAIPAVYGFVYSLTDCGGLRERV